MADERYCQATGCTSEALHQLLWNNPRIHTPERRKIWLACDVHEPTLREFLSARSLYKETVPIDVELPG